LLQRKGAFTTDEKKYKEATRMKYKEKKSKVWAVALNGHQVKQKTVRVPFLFFKKMCAHQ